MTEITKLVHKYLRHDKKFPHVWCPGCGNGIVLGAMIRGFHFRGPLEGKEYNINESADLLYSFFLNGIKKERHA